MQKKLLFMTLLLLWCINVEMNAQQRHERTAIRGSGLSFGVADNIEYPRDTPSFRVGMTTKRYSNRTPWIQFRSEPYFQILPGFAFCWGLRVALSPLERTRFPVKPYIDFGATAGFLIFYNPHYPESEELYRGWLFNFGPGVGIRFFVNNTRAVDISFRLESFNHNYFGHQGGVDAVINVAFLRF